MPHAVFEHPIPEQPILGGWITFESFPLVEQLAGLQFDYLGIDTQHGMLDVTTAARLIYAVPSDTIPVLVRVPSNDAAQISKILDCGADGVIVPMVNTAEEAARAVAACRYAPRGERSFGPVRRHLGREPNRLEQRIACFAMIETEQAVKNVAQIVATPGLTGIYLGPADLAVCLGVAVAATPSDPKLREAQRKVARACSEAGIVAGCHGLSAAHVAEMREDGFAMISLLSDKGYMIAGANTLIDQCRAAPLVNSP